MVASGVFPKSSINTKSDLWASGVRVTTILRGFDLGFAIAQTRIVL